MTQLTEEEVLAWPATGPMAQKAERVLELLKRAKAAERELAEERTRAAAEEARFLAMVDELKGKVEDLTTQFGQVVQRAATAAQHEKALVATKAEGSKRVEEQRARAEEAEDDLTATRARCAMLTEALEGATKLLNTLLHGGAPLATTFHYGEKINRVVAADDAGVAKWLEGVRHEARLAGIMAGHRDARMLLGAEPDTVLVDAIAAHDALVEAKALEKAAQAVVAVAEKPGRGMSGTNRNYLYRARDAILALAGKDGTTS